MSRFRFDNRFFSSTRGKIVLLLRDAAKTVNDLAAELGISDNAVRAHLLSLERDHLIETGGTVKGSRKPHVIYKLSDEARDQFPKVYGSLFSRFLSVLKLRLAPQALVQDLRETGRQLAPPTGATKAEKIGTCLDTLKEIGGAARLVEEDGREVIQSESCPFAEAVAEHPEVCQVAEAMLSEMLDEPVHEVCIRGSRPKCKFIIGAA